MTWQGAFFGAVLGLLLTHNVYGLLLGAIIGRMLGAGIGAREVNHGAGAVSEVFFRATFTLMGHIAKSDGRVSESEIQAARQVMQDLKLLPDQVALAIELFRQGKSPQFNPDRILDDLRRACGPRHDLMRMFVELQMRAAILGNGAGGAAHTILARAAEALGLSALEFVHMEAMLRAQYQSRGRGNQSRQEAYSRPSNLERAYQELEVPANATDEQVKKAYRRQMSRHHPDKLVANGLPESMAEVAKEKTQRIQEAYESICAARGIK